MKQLTKIFSLVLISVLISCSSGSGAANQNLTASLVLVGTPETNGQFNASRALSLMLVFNLPVNTLSISNKNFIIYKTSDPADLLPITGFGEVGISGTIFAPCIAAEALLPNTDYTIQLMNLVSTTGVPLKQTTYFHFTTGETIIPEVFLTVPGIGETNVSLTPIVQLKFSQPAINVNASDVTIHDEAGNNVAITSINASQHLVAFSLTTEKLKPLTKYIVSINSGITDISGNPLMLPNQELYFVTGVSSNPEVASVVPCLGEFNVSLFPVIYLQFSTSVRNINPSTVQFYDQFGNTAVIASITPSLDYTSYAITLASPLLPSRMYSMQFDSTHITDYSGNHLNVPQPQHFYTGTEGIPLAKLIVPNNIINVVPDTGFNIVFSKAVHNVNFANIQLQTKNTNKYIMLTNLHANDNNTFTFSPVESLEPATNYILTLESGINDDNGIPLPQTVFYFMTQ